VTDKQTDGRTDGKTVSWQMPRLTALRGKNLICFIATCKEIAKRLFTSTAIRQIIITVAVVVVIHSEP